MIKLLDTLKVGQGRFSAMMIMVAPAAGFYSTPNIGQNQVRIAYVLNQNDLKSCINILKNGLMKYLKQ